MTEFSVKTAVLYRAGIGFFLAQTNTDSDSVLFPVSNKSLDDFLKTSIITVSDADVTNLSFETRGMTRNLYLENNSLWGLFDFLSGKKTRIKLKSVNYEGKLIGYVRSEDNDLDLSRVNLLDDSGVIQNISVTQIKSITPLEKKDQQELEEVLASKASENDDGGQSMIRVQLSKETQAEVNIAFLSEIPAWKLSYRLELSKDEDAVNLVTYGILDNTTPVNWEDADLILSTKIPLSFRYDLSTPHNIMRETIRRISDMGISTPRPVSTRMRSMAPGAPPVAEEAYGEFDDFLDDEIGLEQASLGNIPYQMASGSPAQATTDGQDSGESVEYILKQKVTVKSKQSAMVPLSVDKMPGKQLLYFNETNHSVHPFYTVQFTNDLGYALDSGPVSVYIYDESMRFGGEAMMSRVGQGDDAFLTHALNRNVIVTKKEKQRRIHTETRVQGVYRVLHYRNYRELTFVISDKSDEEQDLYIAIPKDSYEPIKKKQDGYVPNTNFIDASNEYRVHTTLEELGESSVAFVMSYETRSQEYLSRLSSEILEKLLKESGLSEEEKEIVQKIYELNTEMTKLQNDKTFLNEKVSRLDKRRTQIIETLEVLDKTSEEETRKAYIKEITEIDETLSQGREDLNMLDSEIHRIKRAQEGYTELQSFNLNDFKKKQKSFRTKSSMKK